MNLSYIHADVPIASIFLWEDNPRHQHLTGETAIIAKLCEDEDIYALASDIVRHGINPLESMAVVPLNPNETTGTYTVAEGNRRLCALKLLLDPDRAPTNQKERFSRLAAKWTPITDVATVVFETQEAVRIWLERTHSGQQGGAGRKNWTSDQKQRFIGGSKNLAALHLLNHAEKLGLVSEDERKGKLTTAQRFLDNEKFRNALGLRQKDDDILRDRPNEDFDELMRAFVHDLMGGKSVNSRMNKADIESYAEALVTKFPQATRRIDPQGISKADPPAVPAITPPANTTPVTKPPKPMSPTIPKRINYLNEISEAIKAAKHQKLDSLYHSLTSIDVSGHTPFLTIGAWSLFEILCKNNGASDDQSFVSFLSNNRLQQMTGQKNVKAIRKAVERISENGNTNKHDTDAGSFNPSALVNDMTVLSDVILTLAKGLPPAH